jgi:hypothetical protein
MPGYAKYSLVKNAMSEGIAKAVVWSFLGLIALVIGISFGTIVRCTVYFESCSYDAAVSEFRGYLAEFDMRTDVWVGPYLLRHDKNSATYVWRTNPQVPDPVEVQITVKRCFLEASNITSEGRADKLMIDKLRLRQQQERARRYW